MHGNVDNSETARHEGKDAALGRGECEEALTLCGFIQGLASPCHFWQDNGASLAVSGDDFLTIGRREVVGEMERKILVLVSRAHGTTVEPDAKHADMMVKAHAGTGEGVLTTPWCVCVCVLECLSAPGQGEDDDEEPHDERGERYPVQSRRGED